MHRVKLTFALVFCAVVGVSARAYVLLPNSWSAGIWNTTEVNLSLLLGSSPALQDGSTWNGSAQAALDEWNRHMTVLRLTSTVGSGSIGVSGNGRSEAFFSSTVYGQSFGPNAGAITIISYSGIPERNTEADVIFNTAYSWDSYRGPLQHSGGRPLLDFRRVALHEFGHLIGLGHADQYGATSSPALMDTSTGDLDRLAEDDIAGVRLLYGPGEPPNYADQSNLTVVAALGGSQRITFSNSGGTPFITYQLYRNGALLRTFHSGSSYLGSFTVNFDGPSDFGTYRIVASNRVGQVRGKAFNFPSDPATYAPTIATDLQDVMLAQGEAQQFGIIASGNPTPTFAWFKDGVRLTGQTGALIRLHGTAAESGMYEVVATNAVGSHRSSVAKVTVLPAAAPINTWTSIAPALPPLRAESCAFGNGMFVAVGDIGNVLTSSDGMSWTHRNIGSAAQLNCVIFAAERFVVGGTYDRKTGRTPIYVSFDGVGWRPAESGVTLKGAIVSIAYGDGRFVAADLRGSILTSSDGLNWQTSSWTIPAGDFPNSLAFGNGVFILTGRKDKVWISADGRTWAEHSSGVASGLNSIAFGAGRFVAVGAYPDTRIDKVFVAVSSDGVTWATSIAQSISSGPRVFFLNSRFHITSDKEHLVSSDGSSWEQRNFTQGSAYLLSHGNGVYLALGALGEAFTSTDGLLWIPTSTAWNSSRFSSVTFGDDRFLLFGSHLFDGGLSSLDGIRWQPIQITGDRYNAAAYGNGRWVAVAGSSGNSFGGNKYIAQSADGQSWTASMDPIQTDPAAIAYGAGRFVAVGENRSAGNGGVAYSADGATWTESFPCAEPLRGIAFGPAGFIAVGRNGTLLQSPDGVSWQARASGTTRTLWSVACHGGTYVAVGGDFVFGAVRVREWDSPLESNAVVCRSTDGVNWTAQVLPFEEALFSITNSEGTWIAGGQDGLLLFSAGLSWMRGPRANGHLWRMAAGQGMVVATDTGFPSSVIRMPANALTNAIRLGIPPRVVVTATGAAVSFETNAASLEQVKWFRGASSFGQSTGTSASLAAPVVPGVYLVELRAEERTSSRLPVVIAPGGTALFCGDVTLVRADIVHPNGNIFDQYLLTGPSAQIRARPDRVSRISFRDLSEDIVQVEFSGSGTLTIVLENPSAPARAPNYSQDVDYVKGHARIFISDADETTNVSVFSVGSLTALDQSLFKAGVAYDGIADIGLIAIHSRNGRFGSVRLGNASIWNRTDVTGFWAPDTKFIGPIVLGDISSFESATAGLVVRQANSVTIAGGDLAQANGRTVSVDGTPILKFSTGTDSHGRELPAKSNRAQFSKDGDDVTARMVPSQ